MTCCEMRIEYHKDLVRHQKILGYNYDVLQPAEGGSWKAP
jgi:hypothetical protein